jgi:hypothetical protein
MFEPKVIISNIYCLSVKRKKKSAFLPTSCQSCVWGIYLGVLLHVHFGNTSFMFLSLIYKTAIIIFSIQWRY